MRVKEGFIKEMGLRAASEVWQDSEEEGGGPPY